MNISRAIGFTLAVIFSVSVMAADKADKTVAKAAINPVTAHQVIEQTTVDVMRIITEAQTYFDKDPERFYREIDVVLNKVVDFKSFSRGVMGKYASKKRYLSLSSAAEKEQFKAQLDRFSGVFRDGLVQTYAKGLLAFNGNRIEVAPAEKGAPTEGSVTVVQHIYAQSDKPYNVHYKMRRNKAGEWKLRNVTIEAINLGKVYQSQFYSAAKQYKGDIDKVIDNWTVDPDSK